MDAPESTEAPESGHGGDASTLIDIECPAKAEEGFGTLVGAKKAIWRRVGSGSHWNLDKVILSFKV